MVAEVSSRVRVVADYKKDAGGDEESMRDLVTRDFLGCAAIGSKELDLKPKVPPGWNRRLDLLSGETYLEKSGPVSRELCDLNLAPPPSSDGSALDLSLLLPSSAPRPNYQSVCTLDKVRSALERAERESQSKIRQKRWSGSASPSTSTTTSSSIGKRAGGEKEFEKGSAGSDSSSSGMAAVGCPSCLMYVLVSKGNPRCPRCDSRVPTGPVVAKKPRIDLNSS